MFLEGIPMTSWHHQESDFPQSIMPSSSISYPASWCPQKRWLTIAVAKSPRLDLFRQVPRPHSKPLPPSSVKSLPSPETIPAATQPRGELHGVTHCNSWRQPMYRRLHQIQVLCATRPSKAPLNKNRGWISSQQFSPHEKTRGLFLCLSCFFEASSPTEGAGSTYLNLTVKNDAAACAVSELDLLCFFNYDLLLRGFVNRSGRCGRIPLTRLINCTAECLLEFERLDSQSSAMSRSSCEFDPPLFHRIFDIWWMWKIYWGRYS